MRHAFRQTSSTWLHMHIAARPCSVSMILHALLRQASSRFIQISFDVLSMQIDCIHGRHMQGRCKQSDHAKLLQSTSVCFHLYFC